MAFSRIRPELLALCVLLSILPAGCHSAATKANGGSAAQGAWRQFPVRGRVVSTDATHVVLEHEAVPGFMDAMTMPYRLKDPSVVSELHAGDRISATILARQTPDGEFSDPELEDIVVTAQARPDYKPKLEYHVPQAGDVAPDFTLINQSGRSIHLRQFRGKLLLATFIYTRCNIAEFCPRMSRNFAAIDAALATNPRAYAATHLLSISFDPSHDTPDVLRRYGGSYTGRFSKETFSHWEFAAPPPAELPAVAQWFGLGITPGEAGSLTHSLSTILIGKDGRVIAWYPTNDWQPADVVRKVNAELAAS